MKSHFKKPPYSLILSAIDGNEESIEKILIFYDSYISACCLRSFHDDYGNEYTILDIELKGRIREELIKVILRFDILAEELEESVTTCK